MFVRRKTMEAAVAEERERWWELASRYGGALERTEALQREMSAWVMNKADNITPKQMAAMFYLQDDGWQATFFNVMQDVVQAHHDALPPRQRGEYRCGPGVPAGEGQWFWMAYKLTDSGFETLEAMFGHAKYVRENTASADTHPKGGDGEAAPFMSGAVGAAETPTPQHHPGERP